MSFDAMRCGSLFLDLSERVTRWDRASCAFRLPSAMTISTLLMIPSWICNLCSLSRFRHVRWIWPSQVSAHRRFSLAVHLTSAPLKHTGSPSRACSLPFRRIPRLGALLWLPLKLRKRDSSSSIPSARKCSSTLSVSHPQFWKTTASSSQQPLTVSHPTRASPSCSLTSPSLSPKRCLDHALAIAPLTILAIAGHGKSAQSPRLALARSYGWRTFAELVSLSRPLCTLAPFCRVVCEHFSHSLSLFHLPARVDAVVAPNHRGLAHLLRRQAPLCQRRGESLGTSRSCC